MSFSPTFPIRTTIPFNVLAMRVDAIDGEVFGDTRSHLVSRLKNQLVHVVGIEYFWMLLLLRPEDVAKLKNVGRQTVGLVKKLLLYFDGEFGMFPAQTGLLARLAGEVNRTQGRFITPIDVVLELAGTGGEPDPAICAALATHGLRPGMLPEELFVYDPSSGEKKDEPTVAEELLAIGAMSANVVVSSRIHDGITVIEFMAQLTFAPDRYFDVRMHLEVAMRRHLSQRALKMIGIEE